MKRVSAVRSFEKVLVANRGEIAVRVVRACRDMGLRSVAVFSEADRAALHVLMADEAWPIGPAPSRESYLNIERILDVVRRSGAQAVHPGYGFLAENPAFARACEDAGIVFIGPPSRAMERMGEKTSARRLATEAGVPVVPGSLEPLTGSALRAEAEKVGFPVMLKAAAGGGGKGLRLVPTAAALESALERAQSEALSAFADGRVYVEKALVRPRHVEIQVLADAQGTVVHLFERECSIQRRHQKLLEESPSPLLDPPLRARMGELAVALARRAGYVNAGTLEFLVDEGRVPYFLEMNTRLQVEHPVTEMVTGLDLVQLQIRIARGEPLPFAQEELAQRGHAVECRIYAEDPAQGFLPSPGTILALRAPSGPGIRDDTGVYEGAEVSVHYDPLVSKLVAWGADREQALGRLERALGEYTVQGIRTTLPFFRRLLRDPGFRAGDYDTGLAERLLAEVEPARERPWAVAVAAAAIQAFEARRASRVSRPPAASPSWRGRAWRHSCGW
ncbi:MAG TPA: acetyl-CoA carboxylase biotin carboxylase subunit [Vicinamibacteria bacterium]|nr:acetyl-CoA carboxylase biotin carboxylase subunit [Vicinamibacteria bacterium]